MSRHRRNSLVALITFAAVAIGVALYAQNLGFTDSWRRLIEKEFAKYGYHVEVRRLTLGPIQGLVAEDVRFYQDPKFRTEIASVDHVILDVDLGQILEKKLSLNSIDFEQANVSMRIDPADPGSAQLRIDNFSARAVMSETDIEIVRAEAVIHGLPFSLKGHLHRAPPEVDEDEPQKSKREIGRERSKQLQRITERLRLLAVGLAQLEQFDFSPSTRSLEQGVDLEISGDLTDISSITASCLIELAPFRRGSLAFDRLNALLEFNGQRLSLRELLLRDASGDLRLNAEWPVASETIHFKVESDLHLPRIVGALYNQPAFGEVVFFAPPELQFEGDWILDRAIGDEADAKSSQFPLSGVGSFSCDRFTSRGAVFDAFNTDFSIADNKVYLRNLRLDHKTGLAQANILFDADLGLQYQAEIKFDPQALLAFVSDERIRRQLNSWTFNDESTIYIGAEGSSPQLSPAAWTHEGVVDLRRCRLNGVDVQRFESDFSTADSRHTFTNLRLQLTEGTITAESVAADLGGSRLVIDGFVSDLEVNSLCRLLRPALVKPLAAVRFSEPPRITLDGELDIRGDGELNDDQRAHGLEIGFSTPASAEVRIRGRSITLEQPRGSVRLNGADLLIEDLHANSFGGKIEFALGMRDLMTPGAPARIDGELSFSDNPLSELPLFETLAAELGAEESGNPFSVSARFNVEGATIRSEQVRVFNDFAELNGSASAGLDNLALEGRFEVSPKSDEGEPPAAGMFDLGGSLRAPEWSAR